MSAVSNSIKQILQDLQNLPSLNNFGLGGGTNVALRFNHRESDDIDLFCTEIIGIIGFKTVVKEIEEFYKDKVSGIDFPCEIDDQYVFLRFLFIKMIAL